MNSSHPNPNEHCPSLDSLERVSRGMAPDDEVAKLEHHLDGCASCQECFDSLLGSAEDLADLGAVIRDNSEADLEAIQAAGVPRFPGCAG